jgi:hypothetical protein
MTLFATAALVFALRSTWSDSSRDVWISAAFGGLAASAKFNGAAALASTTVGALRGIPGRAAFGPWRRVALRLLVAAGIAIVVFAITSPYAIRDYKMVHLGLRIQQRVLFSGDGPAAWSVFLTNTLPGAFGWPGFLLALAGVGRALWLRRHVDLVLLAFIAPLFASMAGMTWILPRYPLPLIPVLAIFAAEASRGRPWPIPLAGLGRRHRRHDGGAACRDRPIRSPGNAARHAPARNRLDRRSHPVRIANRRLSRIRRTRRGRGPSRAQAIRRRRCLLHPAGST